MREVGAAVDALCEAVARINGIFGADRTGISNQVLPLGNNILETLDRLRAYFDEHFANCEAQRPIPKRAAEDQCQHFHPSDHGWPVAG
jgi:hypothetical protein